MGGLALQPLRAWQSGAAGAGDRVGVWGFMNTCFIVSSVGLVPEIINSRSTIANGGGTGE